MPLAMEIRINQERKNEKYHHGKGKISFLEKDWENMVLYTR
jgi:hypothetical protein